MCNKLTKVKYYELPSDWQQLMLIRQAQAGNRINPAVFEKKIDASKAEGGFNFKEDMQVRWNDIFHWDKESPLPVCPLPDYKFPVEETLVPATSHEVILFGGQDYYYLAENEEYTIYATKDTIKGMRNNKKSLVLMRQK